MLRSIGLCSRLIKRSNIPYEIQCVTRVGQLIRTKKILSCTERDIANAKLGVFECDDHEDDVKRVDLGPSLLDFSSLDYQCELSQRFRDFVKDTITSYQKSINWNIVIKKVLDQNVDKSVKVNNFNVNSFIISVCAIESLYKPAESFFSYLTKEGKLSTGHFFRFCKLIDQSNSKFPKIENAVYSMYKSLLPSEETLINLCLLVLLKSEKYREETIQLYEARFSGCRSHKAIIGALLQYNNDFEKAMYFLKLQNMDALQFPLFIVLQYLNTQVMKGQIPLGQIVEMFDFMCSIQYNVYNPNWWKVCEDMFTQLNKIDRYHTWHVKKYKIFSKQQSCINCHGYFVKETISAEEIEELQDLVKKEVILLDNINIKTDEKEWKNFLQFLETKSESYNFVIDGLNLIYSLKQDEAKIMRFMNSCEKNSLKPLLLAKQYFKKSKFHKLFHEKYPIFLTNNMSHDDVFVLYAALRRGLNCYFVSRDKMRFCSKYFMRSKAQSLFLRWQATHQCTLKDNGVIVFPSKMMTGFQKSLCKVPEKVPFRYHFLMDILCSVDYELYCVSIMERTRVNKEKVNVSSNEWRTRDSRGVRPFENVARVKCNSHVRKNPDD